MKFLTAFTSTTLFVLALFANSTSSADEPANSTLALEDTFDRDKFGKGWNATSGEWKLVDGVMKGKEIKAEKHAAANRRLLVTQNAVYELNFRLTGDCKSFHFGFDPGRGELQKKGHLFSVIVTPKSWQILKHIDKDRRKEDPNETLAKQDTKFEINKWYKLRVTTWGTFVTAKIDGKDDLKASHPTFAVRKPTLIFRCVGDGVEIADVKVWTQNQ